MFFFSLDKILANKIVKLIHYYSRVIDWFPVNFDMINMFPNLVFIYH